MFYNEWGVVRMFNKVIKKGEDISPKLTNKDKLDAAKENNIHVKKQIKIKQKKLYIISAIVIIVIIVITILLSTYLNSMKYKPYIKYEEKMKTYGFDQLYDNKSAKTNESVTKSEALKLALGATFNTYDILNGAANVKSEYTNSLWVECAKNNGITNEDININNFNDKVKYIDVISYLEKCKINFLKDQPIKDTEIYLKDISKYTSEQQAAAKDMLANEIISLVSKNLNGNGYIFKGQLNELIINFAEKYNTITMKGDKININPEKIPSNADQYPYTITTVDKAVYEKPLTYEYTPDSRNAKEFYAFRKEFYPQIKIYSEEFFYSILNIDYRTITEESLTKSIENYLIYKPNETYIKEYIKHVKDNEIIIEGSAKLQIPAIYSDGFSIRGRMILTFEIKNSKTKENLLYLDYFDGLKKTYEKDSYNLLVDYYFQTAIGTNNIYVAETELYRAIIDKDKCGIKKEVYIELDNEEEVK